MGVWGRGEERKEKRHSGEGTDALACTCVLHMGALGFSRPALGVMSLAISLSGQVGEGMVGRGGPDLFAPTDSTAGCVPSPQCSLGPSPNQFSIHPFLGIKGKVLLAFNAEFLLKNMCT